MVVVHPVAPALEPVTVIEKVNVSSALLVVVPLLLQRILVVEAATLQAVVPFEQVAGAVTLTAVEQVEVVASLTVKDRLPPLIGYGPIAFGVP